MNGLVLFTHLLSPNISNMRQRIAAMLVAVLTMLPVLANDLIKVGNSYYRIVDKEAYYVGEYDDSQTVVIVPEKIEYKSRQYTVVGFKVEGEDWVYDSRCKYVEEFYLPSTIRHTSLNTWFLRSQSGNLRAIHIESGGELAAQDGVLYTSDMKTLLFVPSKYSGVLTVPESVTVLEHQCCLETDITGIVLPEGLQSIGREVFSHSKIERLVIPNSVSSIGDFGPMPELTSLVLGNSITSISAYLLYECFGLRELYIPASVTDIAWGHLIHALTLCWLLTKTTRTIQLLVELCTTKRSQSYCSSPSGYRSTKLRQR